MTTMSSFPLEYLRESSGGFARDPRYAAAQSSSTPFPSDVDPVAAAFAQGHAAGCSETRKALLDEQAVRDAQRDTIELAFAAFDTDCAAELHERLHQTVLALCETAILPLAIDPVGLTARIECAVAMLRHPVDDRRVLLHPDDLVLVRDRLPANLTVTPDPSIERGGLRIETPDGGVEDSPTQWRRSLAEALAEC